MSRVLILTLALLAALGLTQGLSPKAHADPERRWTRIDWDITNLRPGTSSFSAGNAYDSMLESLRRTVSHAVHPNFPHSATTRQTGYYVEVALIDHTETNSHRLSLIVEASNLYVVGYFTPQGRYMFRDLDSAPVRAAYNAVFPGNRLEPRHFQSLPFGENYNSFSRDEWRMNDSFLGLRGDINHLANMPERAPGQNTPPALAAGRALTSVVAAVSEAARFRWIHNRIGNTIRTGYDMDENGRQDTLGRFGLELETRWSRLSAILSANLRNRPAEPVTIDGRVYRNSTDIELGNGRRVPALGLAVALGSQF
ncbi:ribosome-inactivating family protein [Streptomyces sp. NBC_00237]|uniref:ribosome-inactivating family protein n=1 Tax=Streptomyces sp. NBC_00237 TaxID=2975687 RepID=UPI002251E95F|nr:ribosome-inactivating family protein [Streptomyces sp. NBC_00237]MCX5206138.1 ribosome-inactivating family protein [Streptomyces sp. NBC_00237]